MTDDEILNGLYEGYHRFGEDKLIGDIKGYIKPYGPFEVFYQDNAGTLNGWYWWACSGCMPDGDPNGPFDTAREAFENAQGDACCLSDHV